MTKSKADFVVVPVGTPMPREQVAARAARLKEVIPQYDFKIANAKKTRGKEAVEALEKNRKELEARLAELESALAQKQ